MSQCMTCRYALYDGMCLAKGKFTALDAPACDTYAEHTDVEASRLRAENAKLRELVLDMYKAFMHGNCYRWCEFKEPCNYISDGRCQWYDRMLELGIE